MRNYSTCECQTIKTHHQNFKKRIISGYLAGCPQRDIVGLHVPFLQILGDFFVNFLNIGIMIKVCFFAYMNTDSTHIKYYRKLGDLLKDIPFTIKEAVSIRNTLNRKRPDKQGYQSDLWQKNQHVIKRLYFQEVRL